MGRQVKLMRLPNKKDFSKYSAVVFTAGMAVGAGLTAFINTRRGVREIEDEEVNAQLLGRKS